MAGVRGGADVDRALWTIELGARFQKIEGRADRRWACCLPRRFVMAPPQPGPKPFAAYRPSFLVVIDRDIGKSGAGGRVKQVATLRKLGKHADCRYIGDWVLGAGGSGSVARSEAIAGALAGSGSIRRSSVWVCFQSLRATLRGSMPACCHQACSFPAR